MVPVVRGVDGVCRVTDEPGAAAAWAGQGAAAEQESESIMRPAPPAGRLISLTASLNRLINYP